MTTPAYRGPGQPAACASASAPLVPTSWLSNVQALFSGVPTPAYVGATSPATAVPKAGWSRHNPTPAYAMPPAPDLPPAPELDHALLARLIACQLDPALLATGQIAVIVVPLPTVPQR